MTEKTELKMLTVLSLEIYEIISNDWSLDPFNDNIYGNEN